MSIEQKLNDAFDHITIEPPIYKPDITCTTINTDVTKNPRLGVYPESSGGMQ